MPFVKHQDFEAFRVRLQQRESLTKKASLISALKRWKRAGKPFLSDPPTKTAKLYRKNLLFKTAGQKITNIGKGKKFYRTLTPKGHVYIEKAGVKLQKRANYPQKASVWIWVRQK